MTTCFPHSAVAIVRTPYAVLRLAALAVVGGLGRRGVFVG